MEFLQAIGVAIKVETALVAALTESGFTQQQLADRSEIPVRTLRRIEQGDAETTYGQVEAIAHALGLTLDELHARAGQIQGRVHGMTQLGDGIQVAGLTSTVGDASADDQSVNIAGATVFGDVKVVRPEDDDD